MATINSRGECISCGGLGTYALKNGDTISHHCEIDFKDFLFGLVTENESVGFREMDGQDSVYEVVAIRA